MSFRGSSRGRGGSATGANRGGSGFGGRGGRGGGFQPSFGPPASVLEMGSFLHACEGEMVCESINPKIPYFNAPIYLENKTPVGKVDEVLGPINQVYFTIKPQEGIVATSFKSGDKFYIGGDKLLPLEKSEVLDEAPLAVDVVGAELPAEVEVHHEAGAELQEEEPLAVEEEGLQPAVAQGADFAVLLADGGSE
ncbi:H/ACA ribonucleoprotein complex subunit 1 [Histoplasma capsulatum H143]|uniref:H/ACA ribonucleoprotein complex subunit n=1 Tax=Ajellomyces capsulatus (strain H143) TaxID=544712 RepID=C6H6Y4_AJECH|nr:H/ACA ribonucleoprotein complex subunit 1 [Histoplasma capsulatum H143]